MAVFTAISAFVVGAATGVGFAAAGAAAITTGIGLSVAALSAGLAIATSRLIVGRMTRNFRQDAQAINDPGVKLQLGPATDNKIPVMYGSVFTGGIITHANIGNENKTMTYVMVISEQTDTGTYTVNDIYRNDVKLTFGSNASVISGEDSDGNTITSIADNIRCRVYVGDASNANSQIFPTTNKVSAQSFASVLGEDGANMTGLVYAVFSMDYTPEAELVQLGAITFDITNSLSEPSAVLLDYLQNTRYGAGLTAAELDLPSFTDMESYSTAQVDYTPFDSSTTTHNRWQIDGMLSTYSTVKQNIDKICVSAATWFVYNPKVGKFAVKPNRAATTGELANAFVFADDNIISSFDISSTELFSLYNAVESEHPQYTQRDQTDVVYIELPELSLNPNEPLNKLTQRYDLVNDNSRVANLSNIDLRQSRFGTVLSFTADYSALVVDVGDVVKVSNAVYDYVDELFRVIRVDEQEGSDGSLTAQIVLLEYNIAVYDHDIVLQKSPVRNTGIPSRVINAEIIELDNADIANSALAGFPNASITPEMIDMFGLINADPIFSEFNSLNAELANLDIVLSDNSNTITNLTANIIPQLESDLSNNTNSITTLNVVTIPQLNSDLGNLEAELANIETANIDAYFPVVESNIANDSISSPKIITNAVIARTIAAGAITAEKIAANAVTANVILAGTITALQIAAGTITANEIAAATITGNKIAAGTITGDRIQGNTITATQINALAITSAEIATSAIVTDKIAAGAVIADKIAANAISVGKLISNSQLTFDGANFQFELGTSTSIGGYQGAGIFRTQKNGGFGIGGIGASANSFAIAGQQSSSVSPTGGFVNTPTVGATNHRTEAYLAHGDYAGQFSHTSGGTRANLCTSSFAIDATGIIRAGSSHYKTDSIELNIDGSGDRTSFIDFHAHGTVDNSARIIRNSGASGSLDVINRTQGVTLAANATSWASLSDERFKTDLIEITDAANKVSSIRTVTGRYITDSNSTSRAFLIAQDVQQVLPEAVDVQQDEHHTLTLRYTDTIPLLIAAIKEQQVLIESLQQRLDAANI